MRRLTAASPLLHILVCVNVREDAGMPSCGPNGGEAVWEALRDGVQQRGLLGQVWVTRTGCLGWCHAGGTTVAVYPEGAFYRGVAPADTAALLDLHLEGA